MWLRLTVLRPPFLTVSTHPTLNGSCQLYVRFQRLCGWKPILLRNSEKRCYIDGFKLYNFENTINKASN